MGDVLYAAWHFGAQHQRREYVSTTSRILLVDADPAALAAMSQALQDEGHSTATAFDTAAALAIAERLGPFELLIVDVQVAPADAIELARRLRERDPNLQVLYVTPRDR